MGNSPPTARHKPFLDPPAPERPISPGHDYGVPQTGGVILEWAFVLERLGPSPIYWIGTLGPNSRPHAAPVWGVLHDGELYLETSPTTKKARNLAASSALTLHVEAGPSEAVVLEGEGLPFVPTDKLAHELAAAFAAKYTGYEPTADSWDAGGLYRVIPHTVFAWRDMPTATRWRFMPLQNRST